MSAGAGYLLDGLFSSTRQRRGALDRINAAASQTSSDDDQTNQAILQVVSIWLNRLQLISVVTTFYAGLDSTFLGFTAPYNNDVTDTDKLVHASLAGALIFHIFAAVISYIASFALIRFQLVDEEGKTVTSDTGAQTNAVRNVGADAEMSQSNPGARFHTFPKSTNTNSAGPLQPALPVSQSVPISGITSQTVGSARVTVEQVYLFRVPSILRKGSTPEPEEQHSPIELLLWVHTVCITLSSMGFMLAVLGIMAYAWATLATSVIIFTTVCLGISLLATASVIR